MFDNSVVEEIGHRHRATLSMLHEIRIELERRFDCMTDAILALILAVASGEALLLVGPPGAGKSLLIQSFCRLIGAIDRYFEYLLTPFTEPSELWGFWDLGQLVGEEKRMVRMNADHMMQNATVVFLDEVFKGSSAILNSLLAFMNERVFYDRGVRQPVALRCLFAATNELPESSDLRAVQDRFILRCRVENAGGSRNDLTHTQLTGLLAKSWPLTYGAPNGVPPRSDLLDKLDEMRNDIQANAPRLLRPNDVVSRRIAQAVSEFRRFGLSEMSNRRLTKFAYVMLIHRLYDRVFTDPRTEQYPWENEVLLLHRFFLDRDNEEITARIAAAAGKP